MKRVQLQSEALPIMHKPEHGGMFFFLFPAALYLAVSRGFEHPNIKSKQNRDFLSVCNFLLL